MKTPNIRKVGAGITLMPHSDAVIRQASRLARQLGATLSLIHTGASQTASETYIREAAASLNIGYDEEVVWNQTDPAEALANAARQHQIELLVCGAFEGPSLNRRRFLSPLARRLTEDLPCTLLLLAHPELADQSFRRIVAITDFSDASKTSCCHAIWLAEKDKAEYVNIVSIHSIFMDAIFALRGHHEGAGRTRHEEEELLDQFVADLPSTDRTINARVIEATTGFAACDYAESLEADLLVLPWLHASNYKVPPLADWALQVAPCSLLLVPASSCGTSATNLTNPGTS
jgi:nucleotide-binding universal stress UspA family protein